MDGSNNFGSVTHPLMSNSTLDSDVLKALYFMGFSLSKTRIRDFKGEASAARTSGPYATLDFTTKSDVKYLFLYCHRQRGLNRCYHRSIEMIILHRDRTLRIFFTMLVGMGLATPGFAMNCAKAKEPAEKRICANASLLAADAKMNTAYTAILKAAPDAEIRAMLVRSQRRWIAARNKLLNGNWGDDSDGGGTPVPLAQIRKAINERTRVLADRSERGLIAVAQAQRRWLAKYTGGPLAGFRAECEFFPTSNRFTEFNYGCTGAISVQHQARVCSWSEQWATYAGYDYYSVSTVEGGLQAFCEGFSNDCTNAKAPEGWRRIETVEPHRQSDVPAPVADQPKFDAEMFIDDHAQFFDACLTAPEYPPGLPR